MGVLGLIPARGGSKRLRAKNVRTVNGKPLLSYTIETAIESNIFDEVIVSTDDDEIANIAEKYGANVPFRRPDKLASDEAQIKDVTRHVIKRYTEDEKDIDAVMNLLPTSPLRSAEDIRQAYKQFENSDCDYVISVTDYRYTPVRALVRDEEDKIKPYWLDNASIENREEIFARSQDHPDFLADAASIYLVDVETFMKEHTLHGENCVGYYIPPGRAIDIDDKFDLRLVRLLLENKLPDEDENEGYDLLNSGRY